MNLWVAFLGGLAGSLHCVGMCGGFPLALAAGAGPDRVRRQLLYNLGRLNTLVFLGALCGAFGAAVVATGPGRTLERILAVAAGTLMVAIGLEMLGLVSGLTARGAALVQSTLRGWLGGTMRSRSWLAPLALGVFNAFLPCKLIYAFAAQAAATASIGAGMATMLAFGLGTIPAMFALGTTGSLASVATRARLSRASAVLVIAFGLLTATRGLGDLLGLDLHHHHHLGG